MSCHGDIVEDEDGPSPCPHVQEVSPREERGHTAVPSCRETSADHASCTKLQPVTLTVVLRVDSIAGVDTVQLLPLPPGTHVPELKEVSVSNN